MSADRLISLLLILCICVGGLLVALAPDMFDREEATGAPVSEEVPGAVSPWGIPEQTRSGPLVAPFRP